ncbi:hypothetical protein KQI30_12250 [Clostridium bornimense]|uniref:hypothetical protein n=1 Tax=Clostridium bornimense TaxID=1216932 RepID=UPI001C127857|nr:hypothetical protein [Clostridium bornimense]MBU5317030.1 hypothetical protein [Clostridium bornimense]
MGYFAKLIAVYLLITVLVNNIFIKYNSKNEGKIQRSNFVYVILTLIVAFLLSLNSEKISIISVSTILIEVIMTNILISRCIGHLIYKLSKGKSRKKYDVKKEMIRVLSFFIMMTLLVILLGTIKQVSLCYVIVLIGILAIIMFLNIKNLIKEFTMIKRIRG